MAKHVTLSEIGKRAGVSNVAVGAALGLLSNTSSVRISKEKARMIRQIASEMGYQPNQLARAFRKKETRMVGVLFRTACNPLSVGYMIDCIHRELLAASYHAYLSPYQSRFDLLRANVLDLLAWRVDGVVLMNVFQTDDTQGQWKELEDMLANAGVPFVLVASDIQTHRPQPHVDVDMHRVSREATEHLLALGHRHFAYITGGRSGLVAREKSISQALQGVADARFEIGTVQVSTQGQPIQQLVLGAKATGDALGRRKDRPTAIICSNDMVAVSIIEALREHDVRVPRDVSVIGYDDSDYAVVARPPLTSFTPPIEAMTGAAVNMLLKHIRKPDAKVTSHLFPADFVIRQSTGPLAKPAAKRSVRSRQGSQTRPS